MKRTVVTFIIVMWILSSVALAQGGDQGPGVPPSPEVAAATYEARCLTCHGPAGQGDGERAVQAGLAMPDLSDPAVWRETTPARWYEVISNGVEGKAMPPFGEASSNPLRQIDRWNMVFYLYTLATPPAQVQMGEALYERSCAECHGADGQGGDGTPGFTDLAAMAVVSQADLFASIADASIEGHDPQMADVEIWALADYVRTFSYNYAPPVVAEAPAPSGSTAPAASSPFTGGEGVIFGQVVNGTAGAAPPEGAVVALRAFDMNAVFVDAITTTTTSDGVFRFEGIAPNPAVQFEPTATYLGVNYVADLQEAIILSPEQPEARADITVYETTTDDSAVRIERLHIVMDFVPGQMQVAELYILSNDGDRAYVGTPENGTVRLSVPAAALAFQAGGDPSRYLTFADGIADTYPIPPGQSTAESVLIYNMAYDGDLELSRPLPYDTRVLNIFVPDVGVEVSGEGIREGGPFTAQGTVLNTYLADDIAAGDLFVIKLSGEPEFAPATASPHGAAGRSGPDSTQSLVIGVVALAGAAAVAFLYWRGYLRFGPRVRPQAQTAVLLQRIAELDDAYDAGLVKEKRYQAERSRLKAELLALMEKRHR